MITLAGVSIEVVVDPDRGAEISRVAAPGGDNVLFHGPSLSPLRASRGTGYGSPEQDWLSEYRGGWQELFPNAGADCVVSGVPLPFHGEVSQARWEVVERSERGVVLRTPARLPLVLERMMTVEADRPVLRIDETVTNESDLRVPFLLGHHPAFESLPGSIIDLPGATVCVPADYDPEHNDLAPGGQAPWPCVPGRDGGSVDLRHVRSGPRQSVAYLTEVAAGWLALRHPPTGRGVALAWDLEVFPHVWYWTQIGGPDFPWYGRARITALEPATSWPNDGLAAAVGRGQAHWLGPRGRRESWLTLALFPADERAVVGVDRDGTVHWEAE